MASIRNISGAALYLPGVGAVEAGAVTEVPDERVYAYTASENFDPVGTDSKGLHDQAAEDEAKAVAAEEKDRRAAMGSVDQPAPAKKKAAKSG